MITNFIELDFPTVTARKCIAIKRNKTLLSKIHVEGEYNYPITMVRTRLFSLFVCLFGFEFVADGEVSFNRTDLHAANYHVMGVDLRHVDEVENKLKQAEVDFSLPTIILAECVLVYIEPTHCLNLLKWLSGNFPSAVFVNYEQVNMTDRFGDVMLGNLRSRGCTLEGVEACLTLDTQIDRYVSRAHWHIGTHFEHRFQSNPTWFQVPKLRMERCQGVGYGTSVSKYIAKRTTTHRTFRITR